MTTRKEVVEEALNNAVANGYTKFLIGSTIYKIYVDLCDCTDNIIHLPQSEVLRYIEDWRSERTESFLPLDDSKPSII